ncbi:hypothetical protein PCYB_114020 [Plasmodium cynomolgi strain B]|uniref:Uncharacterized protein n=1 Tax=Plasmodium cynomolgi (strain B) TaxID=1120755 RepID=K6VDQ8_PLACD|nr:hypothetical protein PCYB_114020 [Plasmodium cynomolgi strain B]GAB67382.1 hypothetical protein PCYB_114020 [Plasmodium cynomolgi strain B]
MTEHQFRGKNKKKYWEEEEEGYILTGENRVVTEEERLPSEDDLEVDDMYNYESLSEMKNRLIIKKNKSDEVDRFYDVVGGVATERDLHEIGNPNREYIKQMQEDEMINRIVDMKTISQLKKQKRNLQGEGISPHDEGDTSDPFFDGVYKQSDHSVRLNLKKDSLHGDRLPGPPSDFPPTNGAQGWQWQRQWQRQWQWQVNGEGEKEEKTKETETEKEEKTKETETEKKEEKTETEKKEEKAETEKKEEKAETEKKEEKAETKEDTETKKDETEKTRTSGTRPNRGKHPNSDDNMDDEDRRNNAQSNDGGYQHENEVLFREIKKTFKKYGVCNTKIVEMYEHILDLFEEYKFRKDASGEVKSLEKIYKKKYIELEDIRRNMSKKLVTCAGFFRFFYHVMKLIKSKSNLLDNALAQSFEIDVTFFIIYQNLKLYLYRKYYEKYKLLFIKDYIYSSKYYKRKKEGDKNELVTLLVEDGVIPNNQFVHDSAPFNEYLVNEVKHPDGFNDTRVHYMFDGFSSNYSTDSSESSDWGRTTNDAVKNDQADAAKRKKRKEHKQKYFQTTKMKALKRRYLIAIGSIFKDVHTYFSNFKNSIKYFYLLKLHNEDFYVQHSCMSLFDPIFFFFAKYELLFWDPLYQFYQTRTKKRKLLSLVEDQIGGSHSGHMHAKFVQLYRNDDFVNANNVPRRKKQFLPPVSFQWYKFMDELMYIYQVEEEKEVLKKLYDQIFNNKVHELVEAWNPLSLKQSYNLCVILAEYLLYNQDRREVTDMVKEKINNCVYTFFEGYKNISSQKKKNIFLMRCLKILKSVRGILCLLSDDALHDFVKNIFYNFVLTNYDYSSKLHNLIVSAVVHIILSLDIPKESKFFEDISSVLSGITARLSSGDFENGKFKVEN